MFSTVFEEVVEVIAIVFTLSPSARRVFEDNIVEGGKVEGVGVVVAIVISAEGA